ncbi:MAG: hypothetical protein ACXV2C_08875 [Candidatus Bathyarchaeia archaeon]
MQTDDTSANSPQESKREAQKKLVEELKVQWKLMWTERFNDKAKAEGISINDYSSLRVNRGTVIHATRNFKALNFSEIVKEHIVEDTDRFIQPSTSEGGWNKFIKTNITNSPRRRKRADSYVPAKGIDQQPKKGGRGWLHST